MATAPPRPASTTFDRASSWNAHTSDLHHPQEQNTADSPAAALGGPAAIALTTLTLEQLESLFETSSRTGLSSREAQTRLRKNGPNTVFDGAEEGGKMVRWVKIVWSELKEPMMLLLLALAVLYGIWGSLDEAVTVTVTVLLVIAVEIYTEHSAKAAIKSLSKTIPFNINVLRDGKSKVIPSSQLVPGDIFKLDRGQRVPADAIAVETRGCFVDESLLTGESVPIFKSASPSSYSSSRLIYAGTLVSSGRGTFLTIATGSQTYLHSISELLTKAKPPKTPLQKFMKAFAKTLTAISLAVAILVPIVGVLRGLSWKEAILMGISLAYATIPEELPLIVKAELAMGSHALSKKGVLVKKLKGAEALSSVDVLVLDKTGTMTRNQLAVSSMLMAFVKGTHQPQHTPRRTPSPSSSPSTTSSFSLSAYPALSGQSIPISIPAKSPPRTPQRNGRSGNRKSQHLTRTPSPTATTTWFVNDATVEVMATSASNVNPVLAAPYPPKSPRLGAKSPDRRAKDRDSMTEEPSISVGSLGVRGMGIEGHKWEMQTALRDCWLLSLDAVLKDIPLENGQGTVTTGEVAISIPGSYEQSIQSDIPLVSLTPTFAPTWCSFDTAIHACFYQHLRVPPSLQNDPVVNRRPPRSRSGSEISNRTTESCEDCLEEFEDDDDGSEEEPRPLQSLLIDAASADILRMYPRVVEEFPFNPVQKVSVIIRGKAQLKRRKTSSSKMGDIDFEVGGEDGEEKILICFGAPEYVLDKCSQVYVGGLGIEVPGYDEDDNSSSSSNVNLSSTAAEDGAVNGEAEAAHNEAHSSRKKSKSGKKDRSRKKSPKGKRKFKENKAAEGSEQPESDTPTPADHSGLNHLLIPSTPMTPKLNEQLRRKIDVVANSGKRMMAYAIRFIPPNNGLLNGIPTQTEPVESSAVSELIPQQYFNSLTFVGAFALHDPIRAGVFEAIKTCREAGVRVLMATGDLPTTALMVAREVHLIPKDPMPPPLSSSPSSHSLFGAGLSSGSLLSGASSTSRLMMTGAEIEMTNDDELAELVERKDVFARVTPHAKLRIVESLQRNGHCVGMIGDGVNDAAALAQANVGLAIGATPHSTDVAMDSASIVLLGRNAPPLPGTIANLTSLFRSCFPAASSTTAEPTVTDASHTNTDQALDAPSALTPSWTNLLCCCSTPLTQKLPKRCRKCKAKQTQITYNTHMRDYHSSSNHAETIVEALRAGRGMREDMRRALVFYMSCKLALVTLFFVCLVAGAGTPLSPVHLIVLEAFMDNIVTGLHENPEADLMSKPPSKAVITGIFDSTFVPKILTSSATVALLVGGGYAIAVLELFGTRAKSAQSIAFYCWLYGHAMLAMSLRTRSTPLRVHGFFSNITLMIWVAAILLFGIVCDLIPYLRKEAGLLSLSWTASLCILGASFLFVVVPNEIVKEVRYARRRREENGDNAFGVGGRRWRWWWSSSEEERRPLIA
ncbi:ATPase Na K transporting alpha [Quaeritorhiza haematococci]|nr:ATPase Na K transporting alpha [Quaeritorhiza haematococci]